MKKIELLNNRRIIHSSLEEHFNLISINIGLYNSDIKTIFITSVNKGEGKSIASINIAYSLAKLGSKVLILDLDLRKSSFEKRFKFIGGTDGVTNFLLGKVSLEDVIYFTELHNLHVIPSGNIFHSPIRLLKAKELSVMIDSLKHRYDYVIIDTPPVGIVVDPMIIGQYCDASILVLQSNLVRKKHVKNTVDKLKKLDSSFLGIVLNKVEFQKNDYGNYGKYGNY